MKLTNTRAHNNTAYNVATGVAAVDAEEGLDQITGLPNQLLASKGVRRFISLFAFAFIFLIGVLCSLSKTEDLVSLTVFKFVVLLLLFTPVAFTCVSVVCLLMC